MVSNPPKRYKLTDSTQNQNPSMKHTLTLRMDIKEIFQANELKKQASVAILLFDKLDFQQNLIRKDKEGYYILI